MTGQEFISLAEQLTGTPVKGCTQKEHELLDSMLADDGQSIDQSQLNELLLLVNKDRMERPLFNYIFGDSATVGTIPQAIVRFQTIAMLRYGNFIYGYRTLSRIADQDPFKKELGDLPTDVAGVASFRDRQKPLVDIAPISREDTSLVGYLSAGIISAELVRAKFLLEAFTQISTVSWEALSKSVTDLSTEKERPTIVALIGRYRAAYPVAAASDFKNYLEKVLPVLQERHEHLKKIQATAARNQDTYLTWDHMDVYFATSMRKPWEYEDLYDFVNALMNKPELSELNLRHFDPTQSYAEQRIDKGLVESLMLKRAKCTVYSVQDTDTLGKDSELAATMAQGKPVIAYVPTIDIAKRTEELLGQDPLTVLDRLRFILYADESIGATLEQAEMALLDNLTWLTEFERKRVFRATPDEDGIAEFRADYNKELTTLCRIIATSEHRIYEKRAHTLREIHPLGIQVNLDTGVANGVLVVRSIGTCADLLERILTKKMEFAVENDQAAWYLRERISECVFRVVTKNPKVGNCFWNFYLRR
jgi:hypothetical protein